MYMCLVDSLYNMSVVVWAVHCVITAFPDYLLVNLYWHML